MGHEIASLVTELQKATEGLVEVRAHMSGQFWAYMQGMRDSGGVPLATTGAALNPTESDVASDVEGLCGVLARVELLEEPCDVWEDATQTEAARRGELAINVDRLQMELKALQRDGVRGQLHDSDGVKGAIRDAIKQGALLDAVDAMQEGTRQEVTPVLKRVQGIEVNYRTSTAKLDQRLADLEGDIVKAEELGSVREGLAKVQQKVAAMWQTVYGSEVAMGKEVVFCGLTQAELNSCRGVVKEWNDGRERWVIEASGKNILLKAGNIFTMDGHVAKWAVYELEARWDKYGPPICLTVTWTHAARPSYYLWLSTGLQWEGETGQTDCAGGKLTGPGAGNILRLICRV